MSEIDLTGKQGFWRSGLPSSVERNTAAVTKKTVAELSRAKIRLREAH